MGLAGLGRRISPHSSANRPGHWLIALPGWSRDGLAPEPPNLSSHTSTTRNGRLAASNEPRGKTRAKGGRGIPEPMISRAQGRLSQRS
jgi:hypothetical protein